MVDRTIPPGRERLQLRPLPQPPSNFNNHALPGLLAQALVAPSPQVLSGSMSHAEQSPSIQAPCPLARSKPLKSPMPTTASDEDTDEDVHIPPNPRIELTQQMDQVYRASNNESCIIEDPEGYLTPLAAKFPNSVGPTSQRPADEVI